MKFECRTILPKESEWYEIEAKSAEQAANDFHEKWFSSLQSLCIEHEGADVCFARVEVEGSESMISRIYKYGIRRRGGVKPASSPRTIEDIARRLEWADDPSALLAPGWELEETMEEAEQRKWGKGK